jgi:hypothetical protein
MRDEMVVWNGSEFVRIDGQPIIPEPFYVFHGGESLPDWANDVPHDWDGYD